MCGLLSIRKIPEQPHFQHQYPRSSVKSTAGSVSHEIVTVIRTLVHLWLLLNVLSPSLIVLRTEPQIPCVCVCSGWSHLNLTICLRNIYAVGDG